MDLGAKLSKTAKGLEEMKSRAHGLPQKYRSLLIVADGSMSAGELIARLGVAAEAGLQLLLDEDYIEVAPGTSAPAPKSGPAPAPQAGADSLKDVDLGGG